MANTISESASTTQISARRVDISIDTGALVNVTDNSRTVDAVKIDNTANTHAVYLKIYNFDSSSPPTLGSNSPDFILPCAASSEADFMFDPASTLLTGTYVAVVTAAGTGGTTGPTNAVLVKMLMT